MNKPTGKIREQKTGIGGKERDKGTLFGNVKRVN